MQTILKSKQLPLIKVHKIDIDELERFTMIHREGETEAQYKKVELARKIWHRYNSSMANIMKLNEHIDKFNSIKED